MTGILPIKKYGTHSALNMFMEFSMTDVRELAKYAGFTEKEIQRLCQQYRMDVEEVRKWYDGYRLVQTLPVQNEGKRTEPIEVYSPRSVVQSMLSGELKDYWNQLR